MTPVPSTAQEPSTQNFTKNFIFNLNLLIRAFLINKFYLNTRGIFYND
jgi:hypothetical protein